MRSAPPGDPPRRPDPNVPLDSSGGVSVNRNTEEAGMVWVIGPIIAALGLSIIMVLLFILKKCVLDIINIFCCKQMILHFLLIQILLFFLPCFLLPFYTFQAETAL